MRESESAGLNRRQQRDAEAGAWARVAHEGNKGNPLSHQRQVALPGILPHKHISSSSRAGEREQQQSRQRRTQERRKKGEGGGVGEQRTEQIISNSRFSDQGTREEQGNSIRKEREALARACVTE